MSWLDDIGDAVAGVLGGVNNATSGLQNAVSSLNTPLLEQVAGMGAGYLTGQGMGAGLGSMFGSGGNLVSGFQPGLDTSNVTPGSFDNSLGTGTYRSNENWRDLTGSTTGQGFNTPAQTGFSNPSADVSSIGGGAGQATMSGNAGNLANTSTIGGMGTTPNMTSGGMGGLNNLFGKLPGGLSGMQLAGSLYDMYSKNQMANKQQGYINDVRNQINGSYAPGSPEYEMMKKEISARDAAAGRNSQWGARATELAGKVNATRANTLAQTLGPLGNLQAQQAQNQYGGLNSLFGFASQNARMKQLQDMVGKSSGNTFNIGGQ